MKHFSVIIILLLWPVLTAFAQDQQQVQVIQLAETPVAFSVDPKGAVYAVLENGSLIKYDTTGAPVSIPGRKTKSSEWQIDASNPYKIVVFNRDLQIADIYNAQLARINSIDFTSLETGDIALLCGSYDNSFWTLSSSNMELVRISEQLSTTSKTNLSLVVNDAEFSPDVMMESDSRLLIAQRSGPACLFDLFGNMQLRFSEPAKCWSFNGDILYSLRNDSISAYHTKLHETALLETGIKNISSFVVSTPWMVVLSENKIFLFRKR